MSKAIWHEKQILIVLLWSVLIFIGYNVLTAEATTKYDYDSYEEYNEIIEPLCNDKGGKLNHGDGYCYFDGERDKELQFEKELDDRGLGADYTAEEEASWNQEEEKESPKQICNDSNGKWKDGECKFPNDNERQDDEVGFDHTMEEEGLWDKYASDKKVKKICDDVDGKMTKDGCVTDHDGPKADKFEEKMTELEAEERNKMGYQYSEPVDGPPEKDIPEDIEMNSPTTTTIIENNDDEEEESEYEEEEEEEEESDDDDGGGGEEEE